MKRTLIAAAIALGMVGSANAAFKYSNTEGPDFDSSLIFEAWDSTKSVTIDLGNYVAGLTSANFQSGTPSSYTFNIGTAFTSLGFGTDVQWHVIGGDSQLIDGDDISLLVSSGASSFSMNRQARISAVVGINERLDMMNDVVGANNVLVQSSTDPFYAGALNWGASLGQAGLSSLTASTGYFAGPIDGSTVYGAGDGLAYFWLSETNSSVTGVAQAVKSTLGNEQGNGSFILQQDGTLTFHLAAAAVPEPADFAMMLAGLGVVGAIARRRRRG